MKRAKMIFAIAFILFGLIACEREERGFRVTTPDANRINSKQLTTLNAGEPAHPPPVKNEYEENAYALSEGKRLFSQMNCVGCHAHGGGGMGPALMDDKWRYGGRIDQIAATIAEGRPNGMPAWRGRLTDDQIWKLAAYVRTLSGQPSKDAVSSRADEMSGTTPATLTAREKPRSADTADR